MGLKGGGVGVEGEGVLGVKRGVGNLRVWEGDFFDFFFFGT